MNTQRCKFVTSQSWFQSFSDVQEFILSTEKLLIAWCRELIALYVRLALDAVRPQRQEFSEIVHLLRVFGTRRIPLSFKP